MLTRIIGISLLVIAVVAVAFVFFKPTTQPQPKREIAISEEAASTDENVSVRQLTPYSQKNLITATNGGGKALIFFHAPWCPFCIAAEKDILSKFEQIPDDVTIMKADYDTEKELKQKYGVTTQHTFVQVDQEGNEITKWVGGETLEDIVSRLQ